MKKTNKWIGALIREIGIEIVTMKQALNEDFHYYLYKRWNGKIHAKSDSEPLDGGKEAS